ncbi:MAG: hypothetical protein ACKVX7_07215 [Planctomycetota bacterium]
MLTANRRGSSERGTILILVIVLVLTISLIVAGAVSTSFHQGRNTQYSLAQTSALSLAESVTETAQKNMLTQVANYETPTLSGSLTMGGTPYDYTIEPVGVQIQRADVDGVTMTIQPYRIRSSVEVDRGGATVHRIVELTMTPIFQYMIFYRDDLEILPGPSMTLGGRVHSNGSIYVGCGNTLTVNSDYFRCTGKILRERKNDGSATGGTVNIKEYQDTSYTNMTASMDADNPDWTNLALNTWHGTVMDGSHAVNEVAAPSIASIKAFPSPGVKGYFHEHADLVVVDGVAYDRTGTVLTLPAGTVTQRTMYDGRENRNVTVSEINVGLLNSSGAFPANGLIYAYRTDASAAQPNGIRLTNATEILAPMTVVSEDPVYVHGNFNTVNKKGAAVIADAVNLLSQNWNDTKTATSGLPSAAPTTYNLAMVTGIVPTPDGGGSYSGGFENLPRFHENWSGVSSTINGAFINLFDSEIGRAPWMYGGRAYTAPIRNWAFDPMLQDIDNMPPFTPNAVYFRRVVWDDAVPLPF